MGARLPSRDPVVAEEAFRSILAALLDLRRRLPARTSPDLKRRLGLAIQVASSPSCPEAQADGVPCGDSGTACDHCIKALDWIQTVQREIEEDLRASGAAGPDSSDI